MSGKQKKGQQKTNPAQEAFGAGCAMVRQNPVLGPLRERATVHFDDSYPCAREDWAWVTSDGHIYANSHFLQLRARIVGQFIKTFNQ